MYRRDSSEARICHKRVWGGLNSSRDHEIRSIDLPWSGASHLNVRVFNHDKALCGYIHLPPGSVQSAWIGGTSGLSRHSPFGRQFKLNNREEYLTSASGGDVVTIRGS